MKKWRIEFGDLKLGKTSWDNLADCHKSNWVAGGAKVAKFEEEWGKIFNYPFSKATSSGTDAGICAVASLYDLGASRGDEIIVPSLSFIATSNAVLAAGFIPKFVDVGIESMNLDPEKVEAAIGPQTKAIQCVSTMGKPCNMAALRDIADRHKLVLLVDNCEGHGCKFDDKYMGHWGDVSTYSFYVAHLICASEGGMVSTTRQDIADAVNSVRTHGRRDGHLFFDHVRWGINAKMTDLEASLGLEGVENFWWTFNTRKNNLLKLLDLTKDLADHCWFVKEESNEVVCPHAFSVILKDPTRDAKKLMSFLEDRGIKCKRNFGCIPTQHEAFAWMGHQIGDFPNAEYVGSNGLHFGCHQYLTEDDLVFASDCLHEYFA